SRSRPNSNSLRALRAFMTSTKTTMTRKSRSSAKPVAGRKAAKALPPTRSGPRPLAAVVLAAGQGKRMLSPRAKVLHEVAGLPLVAHVLAAIEPLKVSSAVVVIGHDADAVRAAVAGKAVIAGKVAVAVQQ